MELLRDYAQIEAWLTAQVSTALGMSPETIDCAQPLTSLGMDSLALFRLTGDLSEQIGRDLPALLLWEFPSIEAAARHLASASAVDAPEIGRTSRDQPLPLSFSQERIWRHAGRGESGDYNLTVRHWILKGDLDVGALRASFRALVERHEILRTTFLEVEGRPVQI